MTMEKTCVVLLSFFIVGFLLRYVLISSTVLSVSLGNRVEISTPLTSWKRAVEGVSLNKKGINPYDGDAFHESPLALIVYDFLLNNAEKWLPFIFVVCDLLTAALLSLSAKIYMKDLVRREAKVEDYPKSVAPILMSHDKVYLVPIYVASVYLFCPYAIASCAGKSTVVFLNMLIALVVLSISSGRWFEASIFLAVTSYHSFYHISLLVPLVMYIIQNKCYSAKSKKFCAIGIILVFVATSCILMIASYNINGSWRFLTSTYGCILSVPDLTPNIGLFWYFFTEMFEHFRVFFLWTFQLNAFIYTVPLAIRLRREPMLLLFVLLVLIAIFKSYPNIGDVALYLSLLPVWSHLFSYMRQSFLVGCVLVSCTFLAPTLWHLWIYSGSANANFYFAITLAFNTGQIFLVTDTLSAYIKREYYLLNGMKTDSNGKLIQLELQ